MDRAAWLAERRAAVERSYTEDASTYDAGYDPRTPLHLEFVDRLVATTPPGGTILDVPCGTGPYHDRILAAGRQLVGADQSSGMLDAARAKHPDVRLELVGLQELAFDRAFDAVMTVDSMEHVPPEEWPLVVENLARALRPGGHLYLTVEEIDRAEVERAFEQERAEGLPAVMGEHVGEETGGYHYYPERRQVRSWLAEAGLTILDEGEESLGDYGYWHVIARLTPDA